MGTCLKGVWYLLWGVKCLCHTFRVKTWQLEEKSVVPYTWVHTKHQLENLTWWSFFLMASQCSEQRPLSTRSRWKMWKSCHSISCYHTQYISLPTSWLTALRFLGYHACHEIRWSELCCSWTCRGSIPCKGLSISTVPWVIKIKIRSYYNIKYTTFNPLKYCFSTHSPSTLIYLSSVGLYLEVPTC